MLSEIQRRELARRVARDLPDGAYVNLGIGLPTEVADALAPDQQIVFQSENGILGLGPRPEGGRVDPELINAGKQHVTLLPGASLFDHATSFMMIRGGHLDIAVMGAYEVACNGDLANWTVPETDRPPAVGGAMDLAAGARAVWVMMEHRDRDGRPRLLERCTYPLTAVKVVLRVYTELATIEVAGGAFVVRELVGGASLCEIEQSTAAPIRFDPRIDQVPSEGGFR